MDMIIDFPAGLKVNANFGPYTVQTDQPGENGQPGSAPTPFATFLASIGASAGIYVLGFCKQRNLPADGIRIVQRTRSNPFTGLVREMELEIQLTPEFPEKYRDALVRSANQCTVKTHFELPPAFDVFTGQVKADTVGEQSA